MASFYVPRLRFRACLCHYTFLDNIFSYENMSFNGSQLAKSCKQFSVNKALLFLIKLKSNEAFKENK